MQLDGILTYFWKAGGDNNGTVLCSEIGGFIYLCVTKGFYDFWNSIFQLPRMTSYIRFCSCNINASAFLQKKIDNDPDFKEYIKVGLSTTLSPHPHYTCTPHNINASAFLQKTIESNPDFKEYIFRSIPNNNTKYNCKILEISYLLSFEPMHIQTLSVKFCTWVKISSPGDLRESCGRVIAYRQCTQLECTCKASGKSLGPNKFKASMCK